MGSVTCGASSTVFTGSVGGLLGLPIIFFLLPGPVNAAIELLHVHVRLPYGFILVAVIVAPDILGTGISPVLAILLEFSTAQSPTYRLSLLHKVSFGFGT